MRQTSLIALCLAAACATPDADRAMSSPADTADLHAWLLQNESPGARAVVAVPGPEHRAPQDPSDQRVRIGYAMALDAAIDLDVTPSELGEDPVQLAVGSVRAFGTGFVYTAVVETPGAVTSRLHLTDLFLPGRAELYVYDDFGNVAGPYAKRGPSGDGDLWTPTQEGDRLVLQVVYDGADTARALRAVRAVIAEAVTVDAGLSGRIPLADERVGGGACGTATCVVNSGANAGIGYYEFVSGAYVYMCSGGLVAATNGEQTFLTANHCVSKATSAKSMDVWFNYTGTNACSPNRAPDVSGATLLSTGRTGDFTLLRLSKPAPGSATPLGFDASVNVANSNGATLSRHSHPNGASQSYSAHRVDTAAGTCTGWPRGAWIYSRDTTGATMGGSSGSPVLNAQGKVVGQLSGACGTNVNDECDEVRNATVDGALYAYYPSVEPWLDPGTPGCADADADGYQAASCGGTDCNDADPFVHPNAGEACADGKDNDCDGKVDTADSECGTCNLTPIGGTCNANSECCSNKCRGHVCR